MFSPSTRRAASLQFSLAFAALTLAACSGNLPLRYGETLCDPAHPCPAGQTCADSICVPDNSQQTDIGPITDEFVGDWDGPVGETDTDIISSDFCRADAQCSSGEACVDGRCRQTPCFGVTCQDSGDVCAFQCVPTSAACNDVRCVDNLEHCVNGECLPSCDIDPCVDPGCNPSDPNCVAGDCTNGTLCYNGSCVEVTPCGDDGDLFCPSGFLCSLGCQAPSLCESITCNAGWTCVVQTDPVSGVPFPTCVGSQCSGLNCGAGESCIGGNCVDRCEFIACADGGRQCDNPDSLCCNGVCCAAGEICRVIREDQPGVCLRPEGICDPPCSSDEICVGGECLCAEYPNPRDCGGNECCRTQTCDNPCDPNPCAGDVDNPLCSVDCNEPAGYRCVNSCGGVACPLLNTVCDPGSGSCLCGSSTCSGSQCCVDIDAGSSVNLACDDTCDPNPCTQAEFGDNRKCQRDCTRAEGFTCTNFCSGVTCGPNMACDPADGVCKCGGGACNGANNCCVNTSGSLACDDPCTSPNPCGAEACVRDCSAPGGYTCRNNCTAGQCSSDVRNPDCNPSSGQCSCQSDANGTYTQCNTSQCCSDVGVCANPCSPNPCPTAGDSGNETQCVAQCSTTGNDFYCKDPCEGNSCANPNNSQGGRNPDCRPDPGNPSAPQCFCDDSDPDTVCGSGSCCETSGCLSPCSPTNPCPSDPGNPQNGNPAYTKCNVVCADTNDYTCSNPCAGNTCATQNGGRNPQCHSINNGNNAECWCAAAGVACGSGTCCQGSSCVNPCAGNPCADIGTCSVDCSRAGGYVCTPLCTAGSCPSQNPICDPDDTAHACECVGNTTCSGSQCCVDSNGDGTREGCADPCAGNPCGSSGVCVRDCRVAAGYTCNNVCNGTTCTAQNPDCDPSQSNASLRCTCDLTDICAGAECCVNDICDDACNPDPCTTGTNTRCSNNCNVTEGFACSNPCAGNNCGSTDQGRNPQCRSSSSNNGNDPQCYCASANGVCPSGQCCDRGGDTGCSDPCAGNPCGTTGACVPDCTKTEGYTCNPVPCSPACVSPLVCDLSNGHCMCGTTDTQPLTGPNACGAPQQPAGTYPKACCDVPAGPPVVLSCATRACTSASECTASGPGTTCGCDPCTGCVVINGEGTCSHN